MPRCGVRSPQSHLLCMCVSVCYATERAFKVLANIKVDMQMSRMQRTLVNVALYPLRKPSVGRVGPPEQFLDYLGLADKVQDPGTFTAARLHTSPRWPGQHTAR